MPRDYIKDLEKLLKRQGGLYTYADVINYIYEGKFQSFCAGDTWLVTQVHKFPRKTVLDVVFVVGDGKDIEALEEKLTEFAKEIGADMMTATARLGWTKTKHPGWKITTVNYMKVCDGI